MKNIRSILVLIFSILFLSSCLGNNDEIEKAKQELGVVEQTPEGKNEINNEPSGESDVPEVIDYGKEKEVLEQKIYTWKYLTDNKFIELDDLDLSSLYNGELKITGKTLSHVDSIKVNFTNQTSEFPDDSYTLQGFQSGDETFLYNAFSRYEVLDYGTNIYTIFAYSGEEVSKIELTLLLEEESSMEIANNAIDKEMIVAGDFPVLEKYGHPIDIGENKVTYSDIKGLEMGKEKSENITQVCNSDEITAYFTEKLDGWFYWNTCRDIVGDKGMSVYVVRLTDTEYVYEKHYYLIDSGIYGTIELERGDAVDISLLPDLNNKLKEKNSEYLITTIVDNLFSEL